MKNGFNTGSRDDLAIDLESCLVQVEASKAWFTRRILPLSLEQLRWRPGQDRWSIAQCLDHLNITLGLVLPKVDAAVQEGWRNGQMSNGQTGYDPSEVAALKLVDPPVMAPAAAPPATQPATSIDLDRMVDEFHQTRDHYAEAVRRAFGLDLPHILVQEAVAPLVYSLGGMLAFLAAHDRRHMWQSERIRNAARFPQKFLVSMNRFALD